MTSQLEIPKRYEYSPTPRTPPYQVATSVATNGAVVSRRPARRYSSRPPVRVLRPISRSAAA